MDTTVRKKLVWRWPLLACLLLVLVWQFWPLLSDSPLPYSGTQSIVLDRIMPDWLASSLNYGLFVLFFVWTLTNTWLVLKLVHSSYKEEEAVLAMATLVGGFLSGLLFFTYCNPWAILIASLVMGLILCWHYHIPFSAWGFNGYLLGMGLAYACLFRVLPWETPWARALDFLVCLVVAIPLGWLTLIVLIVLAALAVLVVAIPLAALIFFVLPACQKMLSFIFPEQELNQNHNVPLHPTYRASSESFQEQRPRPTSDDSSAADLQSSA